MVSRSLAIAVRLSIAVAAVAAPQPAAAAVKKCRGFPTLSGTYQYLYEQRTSNDPGADPTPPTPDPASTVQALDQTADNRFFNLDSAELSVPVETLCKFDQPGRRRLAGTFKCISTLLQEFELSDGSSVQIVVDDIQDGIVNQIDKFDCSVESYFITIRNEFVVTTTSAEGEVATGVFDTIGEALATKNSLSAVRPPASRASAGQDVAFATWAMRMAGLLNH